MPFRSWSPFESLWTVAAGSLATRFKTMKEELKEVQLSFRAIGGQAKPAAVS